MDYYLVKTHFKLDDGSTYDHKGWYKGNDFIDACEHARQGRAWDLRPFMREGEFTYPERVVEATVSAKRYNVRPREIISFDIKSHQLNDGTSLTDISNVVYAELPGATREDIATLASATHPWERRGDVSGYDG